MNFEEFLKKSVVRKRKPDVALVKSLISTSELDLSFLDRVRIDEISARKLISGYYDVLRAYVEAMSCLDGLKIYNHEAYSEYLNLKGEKIISFKFDKFRKVRNNINYYGRFISKDVAEEYVIEIRKIIGILKSKYLTKIGDKKN